MDFASFGEVLRYMRKKASLTQADLAELTGIHVTHLSRMEKSKRKPPRQDKILQIAKALHLTVDEQAILLTKAGYGPEFSPSKDDASQISSLLRDSSQDAYKLSVEMMEALIPLIDNRVLIETRGTVITLIKNLIKCFDSTDRSLMVEEQNYLYGIGLTTKGRIQTAKAVLEQENRSQQAENIFSDEFLYAVPGQD